ncbi:MAG: pseudouridine synthase [Acidobacteriota bacterium]
MGQQRLQKIIAAAGVTSRRKAEGLITAGRVAVNGEIVRELGAGADPDADLITLDGHPLHSERLRYFVVDKPCGVLCAVSDDRGRPVVTGLLPLAVHERLYPAGRLDLDSEGLVLLTNDGDLMQRVTRPGSSIDKEYEVTVGGRPADDELDRLRSGAEVGGRRLMPCQIEVLERVEPADGGPGKDQRGYTRLRVVLHEGKKNQIRRMFSDAGHRVDRLMRTRIGPLTLERVPRGGVRELSAAEVEELRARSAGAGQGKSS